MQDTGRMQQEQKPVQQEINQALQELDRNLPSKSIVTSNEESTRFPTQQMVAEKRYDNPAPLQNK